MKLKLFSLIIFIVLFWVVGVANAITLDNDGGGAWAEYMSFPLKTTPSEYAQYKIVIDNTTWAIYNVKGVAKITVSYDGFWDKVQDDGDDIRVFNQEKQLYFWIEEFDYSNKKAVIWVNLTAGSSELNIAYGNPSATKSDYENGEQVFEFFDDFEGNELDTSKWEAEGAVTVSNGELKLPDDINVKTKNPLDLSNKIIEVKFKFTQHDFGFWISNTNDYQRGSDYVFVRTNNLWDMIIFDEHGTTYTFFSGAQTDTYYTAKIYTTADTVTKAEINGHVVNPNFATELSQAYIKLGQDPATSFSGTATYDYVKVLKLADPADFGTPSVKTFGATFYIVSKSPSKTDVTLYYRGEAIEQQFNISLNTYADNVYWYLDGSKIKTDTNVLSSSVTVTFTDVGTHKVDVVAVNGEYTATTYWNIKIVEFEVPIPPLADDPSLVLRLSFDEGSGDIAHDESGNGNYGEIHGANWTVGRYGYALSFDREDDYVEVPDSESLKLTNFTITVWIKGHANNVFSRIVSKPTDGTYDGFDFVVNKRYSDLLFRRSKTGVGWSGGPSALGVLKEGEWQFFAVRVWNDGANTYAEILDGSGNILASYTWNEVIVFNTTKNLRIGSDAVGTNHFNGIIDEVRIYNRALSPEEIKAMYEALRVKFYDESTGEKIKANATIFNANHSINLQVDSITKEAVLFHSQVPEYGEYRMTITKTDYADRHRIVTLSSDSLVETNVYLPPSSEAVLNKIEVVDYSNKFYTNTKVILKRSINNTLETIEEQYLSPEHDANIYFLSNAQYQIYLDNGEETRNVGLLSYDPDGVITLYITALNFTPISYGSVLYNVTYDNGTIVVQYKTVKGTTSSAELTIYNSTGAIVYQANATTQQGKFTFLGDPNETYTVHFRVQNDFEPLEFKVILNGNNISIQIDITQLKQLPEWFRIMFFGGLCLFVAMLFKRSHVPVGLMLSFSLAAVFATMGILPLNQGLLWVLAILVGLSFFVWWRERR